MENSLIITLIIFSLFGLAFILLAFSVCLAIIRSEKHLKEIADYCYFRYKQEKGLYGTQISVSDKS